MNTPRTHIPELVDGMKVQLLAKGTLLRADKKVGTFHHKRAYVRPEDIRWYSLQQLAERARVPLATVVARVKDRWVFSDIIRPEGWERVVAAKRDGIEYQGQKRTLSELAKLVGATEQCIRYRLAQGWGSDALFDPGRTQRTLVKDIKPDERVLVDRQARSVRGGEPLYSRRRFLFDGAVDTLAGHCRAHGKSLSTVRMRLNNGMTVDEAFKMGRKQRSDKGVKNPKRGQYDKRPKYEVGNDVVHDVRVYTPPPKDPEILKHSLRRDEPMPDYAELKDLVGTGTPESAPNPPEATRARRAPMSDDEWKAESERLQKKYWGNRAPPEDEPIDPKLAALAEKLDAQDRARHAELSKGNPDLNDLLG